MALRISERDGALWVDVQVSPRASKSAVLGEHEGALKVALAAPPVDGAANRALIELLSDVLGVPRRDITLVRGEASKRKTVAIRGVSAAPSRAWPLSASGSDPHRTGADTVFARRRDDDSVIARCRPS